MSAVKKFLFSLFVILIGCLIFAPDSVNAASLYWPVPGHTNLSQGLHGGNSIDISDGSIGGSDVIAAMGGTVTTIYLCPTQHYGSTGDCNGFGTGIVINGDDGRVYQYAHMQAGSVPSNVYYGAYVSAGQTIGKVGTTGNSTGNHLHFGISIGKYWYNSGINPANESYIYTTPAPVAAYNSVEACNIKDDDVTLKASIPGKVITECAFFIGTDRDNMKLGAQEFPNCYVENIFYDPISEDPACKIDKLEPGTKYYYYFYYKTSDAYYESEVKTFTTTGTKEVTVKFDAKGGTCSTPSKKTIKNIISPLPIPKKNNFKFLGWYTSGGTQVTASTSFTKDTTVYAKWKALLISMSVTKKDTTYYVGDTFDGKDVMCVLKYADGAQREFIIQNVDYEGLMFDKAGKKNICYDYEEDGVIVEASLEVTVVEKNKDDIIDNKQDSSDIAKDNAVDNEVIKEQGKLGNKTVVPKVSGVKLKAKKKALQLKWNKIGNVSGYELQISKKKSFKNAKTIYLSGNRSRYLFSKLKNKCKYYVRIRAYQYTNNKPQKENRIYGKYVKTNKCTK